MRKLLSLALLLVAGCAYSNLNPKYPGPKHVPKEIIQEYSYDRYESIDETLVEADEYDVKKIVLNCEDDHRITIDFYDQKKDSNAILVLPILGGSNTFANMFAKNFADHGYSAFIVHRQKKYKRVKDIDKLNGVLQSMVIDHKQALDYIDTIPYIHKKGVFGISMGSIKAALVSGLDDRIDASMLCLTGGDIPYILKNSTESGVKERVDSYLMKNSYSKDELYTRLKGEITCDPLNYAEYIDARKCLMVLGRFDTDVPYKAGIELRDKIGGPETIYLPTGHRLAALYIPYIMWKSVDHFDNTLGVAM